jgi:hypothetical protein
MSNVINLCEYRKEKETSALFSNFEKRLAQLNVRMHYDYVLFDNDFKPIIIWGLTHEQIFSNQK